MQPKSFQEQALAQLSEYLEVLKDEQQRGAAHASASQVAVADAAVGDSPPQQGCCERTWRRLRDRGLLPGSSRRDGRWVAPPWVQRWDARGEAIPHICCKIPTGGGKTWLGVAAVERIQLHYLRRNTGLVLWVVPTRAIYAQTLKKFQDRTHPYYQIFARSGAGRVKVLQKYQTFTQLDIQHHLCIMMLMLQSTNRTTQASLKVFQDSGHFMDVFPDPMDAASQAKLYHERTDLDVHRESQALGGTAGVVIKHSLANALKLVRPVVILDEGHRAYSPLARRTLSSLSPRFILELSATPNHRAHLSNILVDVPGSQLQAAQMIKLPIHLQSIPGGDWHRTIDTAWVKLQELARHAEQYQAKTRRYIRPIMLIQVERTGKEQRTAGMVHSEDVRAYLEKSLGVPAAAIRVKTATRDELKREDLLSELCPVRCIITKHALQEGWDCSFAYILTLLAGTSSQLGLTQLIGRILRQPYAASTDLPALDASYVFCSNRKVAEVVAGIHRGLRREGLADLADEERVICPQGAPSPRFARRAGQPAQVLSCDVRLWHRSASQWRPLIWAEDVLKELAPLQLSSQELSEFTRRVALLPRQGSDVVGDSGSTDQAPASADMVVMAAQLSSQIMNPFVAAQMIRQLIAQLHAAGMSRRQIDHTRWQWFDELKQHVAARLKAEAVRLFEQKLLAGWLRVELHLVSPAHNTPLLSRASPHQGWLAQVEAIPWAEYNQNVAWYDESKPAIQWWCDLAAGAPMSVHDEAELRVYPDGWLARHAHSSEYEQLVYKAQRTCQHPQPRMSSCQDLPNPQHERSAWMNVGQVRLSFPRKSAVSFKLMLPRPRLAVSV